MLSKPVNTNLIKLILSSRISLFVLVNNPFYQFWLLVLITVIAAILRFYKLGQWSFWGDEMFTLRGREDGFNYNLIRESISQTLIQISIAWLGINEWNARLVPALIGTLSIPLLYYPIRKIFDAPVGLVASLLLAISPWHLYWSQNARFYVALLLFYSLALLTFYIGIEENRPWYLIISLILLGLAVKERLLALFFIPVVVAYLILLKILPFEKPVGLSWRNLAIFLLPGLIGSLFFVSPYVLNFSGWLEGFGYANNNPLWLLAGTVNYVGIGSVCMGGLGAIYLLRQRRRVALLMSLNAVIPLLILIGLAPFHYTANRYVFISLTSCIILASLATIELLRQSRHEAKILAGGVLLLLLLPPLSENVLYYLYQNGNRDNWKAALTLVREQKQADDRIVTSNPELADYYVQEKTTDLRTLDLATIEAGAGQVWFVEDMVARELFPQAHHWFEQNAHLIANYDVQFQARNFRMRVYRYDPANNLIKTIQSTGD